MSILKFDYQFKYNVNENINQRKYCYDMLMCTFISKKNTLPVHPPTVHKNQINQIIVHVSCWIST